MSLLGLCVPGKNAWRPRHGKSLMPKSLRNRYEELAASILKKGPKKLFWYPVVAIVIGTALAFAGHLEVPIRSVGILLLALWLSVDLWIVLLGSTVSHKRLRVWRYVIGWTATSTLLIGTMVVMYWLLSVMLKEATDDSYYNLRATVTLPVSGDPFESQFTFTNGGRHVINTYQIRCGVNVLRTIPLNQIDQSVSDSKTDVYTTPLKPGGDAVTSLCLESIGDLVKGLHLELQCADISPYFLFTVDSWPWGIYKPFRFAVYKSGNSYQWESISVDDKRLHCAAKPL
jgi:hypothetical protein